MNQENEPGELNEAQEKELSTFDEATLDVDANDSSNPNDPEVVKEKSSGGGALAIFMALLSLIISGFLGFQYWRSLDSTTPVFDEQSLSQKIQAANEQLTGQLSDAQKTLASNSQKIATLEQQINQANQLKNTQPSEVVAFDNQPNVKQFAALSQRLQQQERLINQLQQPSSTSNLEPPVTVVSDTAADYAILAAIQGVKMAQVFMENKHLEAATKQLDQAAADLYTQPIIANNIRNTSNQLKQLKQPDTAGLTQQLNDLSQEVSAMQLKVVPSVSTDSRWYEKFISVKKLADTDQPKNSADLVIVKTHVNQYIMAAKMALILKDQQQWEQQLQAAEKLLQTESPSETSILQKINQLAGQSLSVTIPSQVNLEEIVSLLKEQSR